MNKDLACHMIHSQYQLNLAENQERLANAKIVIVGAGWADYSMIKEKAPNAKVLVSFNLHMIRANTPATNQLLEAFRIKLTPFILKNENNESVANIDYPNNWEYYFSKELAKVHAKAIWEMIKDNPQIDGIYIDDCWGVPPTRYFEPYSSYYGEPETVYIQDFVDYKTSFLRSLNYWIPNDKIIVCNTAGALAKGCSGISIEKHYDQTNTLLAFKLQKGFWNICWPRTEMIKFENNHTRVLEGVFLDN